MGAILFFWWLGSFVFFKVAFDASFNRDMSVIAAILLGVMVAISVFATGYFYAVRLGIHLAKLRMGEASNFFASAVWVWLIAGFINVCLGKAVVFGFSKDLNRALGSELWFEGRYYADRGFLFAALVAIPITFHFFTILFSVGSQSKAARIE